MAYPRAIREQAKALYIAGANVRMIAESLDIQRQETIWEWARKYKWKLSQSNNKIQTKTEIENKIVEKSVEVACNWIDRHTELAKEYQERSLASIRLKDPRNIRVSEAIALGKEGCDIERKTLGIGTKDGSTTVNIMNIFDLVKMLENKNE